MKIKKGLFSTELEITPEEVRAWLNINLPDKLKVLILKFLISFLKVKK